MFNRTPDPTNPFTRSDADEVVNAVFSTLIDDVTIHANGDISTRGISTGLAVSQRRDGTVVYTKESQFSGTVYQEHKMPHQRYSLALDRPASGAAGRAQFIADIQALIDSLGRS